MRTLKEIINNRQLFESYGIQLLDNKLVETEEEFISELLAVNMYLQKLDVSVISNNSISEKDLTDVKFYINDMICELNQNKDGYDKT